MNCSYMGSHRPRSPIEYPEEVATIDKILSGEFFPDDILDNARAYFADYDLYRDVRQVVAMLKKVQDNPDMELTIYRGAPSNGALNRGDWVTLSRDYANTFAFGEGYCDNENSMVYSYRVKAKEISFDGDSIYEYGYWGRERKEEENAPDRVSHLS